MYMVNLCDFPVYAFMDEDAVQNGGYSYRKEFAPRERRWLPPIPHNVEISM